MAGFPYARGVRSKAMCTRCGRKVRYTELILEWTEKWVCAECWDPKPAQLNPKRFIPDPIGLQHPRPDTDNDGTTSEQLWQFVPGTFGDKGP